ncbi:unnamed protein product [Rodentolepis nana]|uniref:Uncharacterized protein n=1 Tax=Rodentolepis nana TaxID=102285 RepID=A0A3P7RQX0_RODNA|nr:unnamed protein product [Rodentolepis nana]
MSSLVARTKFSTSEVRYLYKAFKNVSPHLYIH